MGSVVGSGGVVAVGVAVMVVMMVAGIGRVNIVCLLERLCPRNTQGNIRTDIALRQDRLKMIT